MKYQILTVGLKDDLLSYCGEHFLDRNIELKNAPNISNARRFEPVLTTIDGFWMDEGFCRPTRQKIAGILTD